MKLRDILNTKPIRTTYEVWNLLEELEELGSIWYDLQNIQDRIEKEQHILVREHLYQHYDYDRGRQIQSALFKGKPALLWMNAGRGGRDEERVFVLDRDVYMDMLLYLFGLLKERIRVSSLDEEVNSLYGHPLTIEDFKDGSK